MMIVPKDESYMNQATITVEHENGLRYKDMDIPPDPFFQEGLVSFWHEGNMIFIPIAKVNEICLNLDYPKTRVQ